MPTFSILDRPPPARVLRPGLSLDLRPYKGRAGSESAAPSPQASESESFKLDLKRGDEASLSPEPCFFVLCKRHWINRVPGAHHGDSLCVPSTLTLTLAMPSYL